MTNEELERRLLSLTPMAAEVDRDRLMFEAGCAAATPRNAPQMFWKASTGLMTAATVLLAVMLARQPESSNANKASSAGEAALAAGATEADPMELVEQDPKPPVPEASVGTSRPFFASAPAIYWGDPATNYLALRNVVLRRGVDAWRVNVPRTDVDTKQDDRRRAATVRELMQEFIPAEREFAPPSDEQLPTSDMTRDEETMV